MTTKVGRIPSLDGIRGFAIGLVLLWHGFFGALTALPNHPFASRFIALCRLSWSGVDLFFVLSGFLIGGILLDAADSKHYFLPFYIRRAHRILPLYGIVLIFVFLVPLAIRSFGAIWIENRIPLHYYLGFLQNLWMAKNGNFGSNILGVTWSLAVEEQFYLTLPLAIRYTPRSLLWWIVGVMILGAPVLRVLMNYGVNYGPFASYVLMPCRADALGLGLAAALMTRNPRLWQMLRRHRKYLYCALVATLLGLLVLLLSGFSAFTNSIFGLEYSLLGLLYFQLLLTTLLNRRFDAIFSTPTLRYLGTIAYGLYLLHFVTISGIHALAVRIHQGQSGWLVLVVSISGICLAIVLAAISWEFIEKPLIRRGHRYKYADDLAQMDAPIPALT
jgi:peptidoglycan/LPS O-acetylase OafA/YrhL